MNYLDFANKDFISMEIMYKYTEEYDVIVVNCQQYLEKSLKHLYELKLNELNRSHKIVFLAKQLAIPEILKYINELRIIQEYYFDKRYPSESYIETTKEECEQAVKVTRELKYIIETEVSKYSEKTPSNSDDNLKQCNAFDIVNKKQ